MRSKCLADQLLDITVVPSLLGPLNILGELGVVSDWMLSSRCDQLVDLGVQFNLQPVDSLANKFEYPFSNVAGGDMLDYKFGR